MCVCYLSFKNNHIVDIIMCAAWVHISSPFESEINNDRKIKNILCVHQIKST